MNESQLRDKLALLELADAEQIKSVTCSLIGHSRIQTTCFGYYYCGRCGDQVGDTLASVYPGVKQAVIVGHKCEICEANYAECTWEDKFMCPDPFADEGEEEAHV